MFWIKKKPKYLLTLAPSFSSQLNDEKRYTIAKVDKERGGRVVNAHKVFSTNDKNLLRLYMDTEGLKIVKFVYRWSMHYMGKRIFIRQYILKHKD